jgi:hypothetical protein
LKIISINNDPCVKNIKLKIINRQQDNNNIRQQIYHDNSGEATSDIAAANYATIFYYTPSSA